MFPYNAAKWENVLVNDAKFDPFFSMEWPMEA